jgi:hypothetical protein
MKNGITLKRRKAFEVPRGNAVIFTGGGEAMVCLKTERQGKDYIHHYLVVMDPVPAAGFGMIYIDPEYELTDCGATFTYAMNEGVARGDTRSERAAVGDLLRNAGGLFLKVTDDPKSQKMFAFIDIHSGAVMSRQERGISAVFQDWRVSGLGVGGKENGAVTIDDLRRLHSAII